MGEKRYVPMVRIYPHYTCSFCHLIRVQCTHRFVRAGLGFTTRDCGRAFR